MVFFMGHHAHLHARRRPCAHQRRRPDPERSSRSLPHNVFKLKSPRFGRIVDGTPLVLFERDPIARDRILLCTRNTGGRSSRPGAVQPLIETHERMNIFCGYLVAGVLARCGARAIPRGTVLELRIGVSAERRSLEEGQTAAWPSITLSMRCSYLPSEPCSFTSLL